MERERGAAVTCDGRLFHRRADATGNALSPTVDRRVRRTSTVNHSQSSSGFSACCQAAGRRGSSHRYVGARPCWHLYANTVTLAFKVIGDALSLRSQWSRQSSGLMWSNLDDENVSLAAAFSTDWSRWRRYACNVALPKSSRESTS